MKNEFDAINSERQCTGEGHERTVLIITNGMGSVETRTGEGFLGFSAITSL